VGGKDLNQEMLQVGPLLIIEYMWRRRPRPFLIPVNYTEGCPILVAHSATSVGGQSLNQEMLQVGPLLIVECMWRRRRPRPFLIPVN
jgi:hypothetical protein